MLITCWSVKGGAGATVAAASLALTLANDGDVPVVLLDLQGDQPATLGLNEPAGPGAFDWLHAGDGVGPAALAALACPVTDGLSLIPRGMREAAPSRPRWGALAAALGDLHHHVVIDAGLAPVPPALADASDHSLLVIRPCFLALSRASTATDRPTGLLVVNEPGRALGRREVEQAIGITAIAEMQWDPAVARAVDAGLLRSRLPAVWRRTAKQVLRRMRLEVGR